MTSYEGVRGKRLAVVGAGVGPSAARQRFYVERCREYGVNVVLFDTIESPLKEDGDDVVVCNTTDFDVTLSAFQDYRQTTPLDGVISFVEERAEVAARLAAEFRYPGHSVAGVRAAGDKRQTRDLLKKHGVPTPHYVIAESLSSYLKAKSDVQFPCFLKLTSGSGSVGTRRIDSPSSYDNAYDDLVHTIQSLAPVNIRSGILGSVDLSSPTVIIEDYLQPARNLASRGLGRFTIEILVQNGVVHFVAIGDGECVSQTDHRYRSLAFPTALPGECIKGLVRLAGTVVRALNLCNGPVVIDAVVTDFGSYIFEVNARIDSAIILPSVEFSFGVDMVLGAVEIALGLPLTVARESFDSGSARGASVEIVLANASGIITSLELPDPSAFDCDVQLDVRQKVGDYVHGPEGAYIYVARANVRSSNRSQLASCRSRFWDAVQLRTDGEAQ